MAVDDWVKDNWSRLREERGWGWGAVVKAAEERDDVELAAWARGEAEKAGKDTTPKDAAPAPKRKA